MKRRYFTTLCFLLLLTSPNVVARPQTPSEDQVRGGFLSTRPTKATKPVKKPVASTKLPVSDPAKDGTVGKPGVPPASGTIGVGYSLYLRDENNRPVRVDAAREFHTGDAIRLIVEPNIDGFLYIFHTENDQNPIMLFPDARLQAGSNAVRAHVPYEVPSSTDPNTLMQWFVFEGEAAVERVFVMVTRAPLADIPTGEALVKLCEENEAGCPWSPQPGVWQRVLDESKRPLIVGKSKTLGQPQSAAEKTSVTRSLGLPKSAPPPAVVYMNPTADKDNLVTVVSLSHK